MKVIKSLSSNGYFHSEYRQFHHNGRDCLGHVFRLHIPFTEKPLASLGFHGGEGVPWAVRLYLFGKKIFNTE